jgi:hypothetical protein
MLLLEDKRFYVYTYMDPTKPGPFFYNSYKLDYEPFYIGKGKETRYLDHLKLVKKDDSFFYKKLRKMLKNNINPVIIKIQENLNEKQAYQLEKELVNVIGRIYYKNGPLTNINDGGGTKPKKNYEKTSSISKQLWQNTEYRDKVLEGSKNNWKIIFPDKTEKIIRDLSNWCKENNFIYSSCKAFASRKIKYKNYCFINLNKNTDLNINDFSEPKKYSERKYFRNSYKITKNNGKYFIIYNKKMFCKKNKISFSTFRKIVNTGNYFKNLFKIDIFEKNIKM